jgi:osmotically-inducible protein OsmY
LKNDRELQRDVAARLEQQLHLGSDMVGVEVHHGTIRLAGRVPDSVTRTNAERAAREVDGVLNVVLDIDVTGPTGARPAVSEGSVTRPGFSGRRTPA